MKFDKFLTDSAVCLEVGSRIRHLRVAARLTQAQLAEQAGIAKRAIERLERGSSNDLLSLVRTLRVLKVIENLESLLPDLPESPVALLTRGGRKRMRVKGALTKQNENTAGKNWKWGD